MVDPVSIAGVIAFLVVLARVRMAITFSDGSASRGLRSGLSYRFMFAVLAFIVPMIAAVAYLFMAFGLGTTMIDGREVVWVRYFEWSITTSLIILGLASMSGRAGTSIKAMLANVAMVIAGFLATILTGTVRGAMFVAGGLLFVYVVYLIRFRLQDDRMVPDAVEPFFIELRALVIIFWLLYPVAWLISPHGIGLLTPFQGSIMFLGLDILVKAGFVWLLLRHLGELDLVIRGDQGQSILDRM